MPTRNPAQPNDYDPSNVRQTFERTVDDAKRLSDETSAERDAKYQSQLGRNTPPPTYANPGRGK